MDQYTRDLNDFARIMRNTQEPVDEPEVEEEGEEDESEGVEDNDGGGEEVDEPSPDAPKEGDE